MQSTSADVRGPLKVEVLTQQGWRGRIGAAAAAVRPGGGGRGWGAAFYGAQDRVSTLQPVQEKTKVDLELVTHRFAHLAGACCPVPHPSVADG